MNYEKFSSIVYCILLRVCIDFIYKIMAGKLTYKDAGVDTIEAASFVSDIKGHVKRTQKNRQLMGRYGLFAAAFDMSAYKEPVLVTGCDGVGTKMEVLIEEDLLEIAGKDLVAMSVNDILTTGGDPLLFLDYVGVNKLNKEKLTRLIAGMCDYLEECDCILAGGETAEMPGIVPEGMIEFSGFCIGAVEKPDLVDPSTLQVGDVLVGFPSDSFHANGWSLVRKVLAQEPDLLSQEELHELLAPTRLYHDVVKDIREAGVKPKASSHITGGGLPENLERLFGEGIGADITVPEWENPVAQKVLKFADPVDRYHTFNMGVGWVAIVSPEEVDKVANAGPGGFTIGTITDKAGVRIIL